MSQNSKTLGGGAVTALKSPLSVIDYDLREDLYSPGKNGGNGIIGNINMATSGRKSNLNKYVNNSRKNNDSVDR